jgi:hypothetical protein
MDVNEAAEHYATRLQRSKNITEARKILNEISKLTYLNSNRYISKDDQIKIVGLMKYKIIEKADNSAYLDLIAYMLQQLGGKSLNG